MVSAALSSQCLHLVFLKCVAATWNWGGLPCLDALRISRLRVLAILPFRRHIDESFVEYPFLWELDLRQPRNDPVMDDPATAVPDG